MTPTLSDRVFTATNKYSLNISNYYHFPDFHDVLFEFLIFFQDSVKIVWFMAYFYMVLKFTNANYFIGNLVYYLLVLMIGFVKFVLLSRYSNLFIFLLPGLHNWHKRAFDFLLLFLNSIYGCSSIKRPPIVTISTC